jgi:recombination protein RecA
MATTDREKALEAALAQIDKQYGKGSVMRLGEEVRAPIEVIPTGSIALDVALGIGGLPRGRVVEIYGPESSGKTTVALHAIANAQAEGGICAFIDAEHALDPEYAARLGVDTDSLLVSQPDNGEQALEIADMLVRSGALALIVIDSVAALTPRAEIEGEMGDSHVGLQARLMSQALRKMTRRAERGRHHGDLHQPAAGEDRRDVRLLLLWNESAAGRWHDREDRQDRQPEAAGRGPVV